MQVQASGVGPASGYSSPLQSAATRPQEEQQGGSGGSQAAGGPQGGTPENRPVTDPFATRGRNVNITV
ncbi:hypothetical protein JL100_025505 [Skermanella mucosa]|uniref:hypothetical protein n=1 Tax=Skermanella mucosa TaxID=1789672 RepID=UPI00192BEF6F|nr:hypothetical protein [Skermanella mucosa]UEM20399.1 hypothetical protein JL100_025505 [Skermanella mucosa]